MKKNGFAQYAVMYTKVMKLLNSVLNASSRRVNLKNGRNYRCIDFCR